MKLGTIHSINQSQKILKTTRGLYNMDEWELENSYNGHSKTFKRIWDIRISHLAERNANRMPRYKKNKTPETQFIHKTLRQKWVF